MSIQDTNKEKERSEIKEKIRTLLEKESDSIEEAAERLAPGFDYEKAAEELKMEEAAEDQVFVMPPAEVSSSVYPKPRRIPQTGFGRMFLRDRHQKTLLITLIALLAVVGWKVYEYETVYAKAVDTTAMIGGQEVEFRLIPGTVKDNLIYNDIAYDDDDEIAPALKEKVSEDTVISVDEVHYTVETKTEKVKKETYVMLDPEMESGEQEQKKGRDGEGVFSYKTKFVNGEEKDIKRELCEWITEPEDGVLHLGTKRTGHEGRYKVTGEFTANCSAYWMGDNCRGASGGRCVYGTVAVDRNKYPYGTEFWIEGYGFAVANDCGSSIKGDKLDLWMDSFAESCQWGRRHKQTYILEKVEK